LAVKSKNVKAKISKKSKKNTVSDKLKKQVEELNLKNENLSNEVEKFKDKNIRLLAEFENYKKRSINERKNLTKYAGESIIKDLITVLDDFSRTIESTNDDSPLLDGVKLVESKINKIFEEHGVLSFDSIGELFNPELHEALMNQETEDEEDGVILSEFTKGYKYHDKILRHAKVVVSKAKQEA